MVVELPLTATEADRLEQPFERRDPGG
jgi:hypothetical protein